MGCGTFHGRFQLLGIFSSRRQSLDFCDDISSFLKIEIGDIDHERSRIVGNYQSEALIAAKL